MASPEARKLFAETVKKMMAPRPQRMSQDAMALAATTAFSSFKKAALDVYPVNNEETTISGVKVSIYTPKEIAPRNKNRVALEFEIDAEAIMLAAIGKMKVISVHYAYPKTDADVVAVYRELLKTHKPKQIAMFGLSGGCQIAATTAAWLPEQKLPFPGALGLITCAGGGFPGDTRVLLNGIDPNLSDYTGHGVNGRSHERADPKPGEAPEEILKTDIPKGYPPSYLVCGERDMSLSETILLHRKLRHAGVVADLNVFEGLWHGATMDVTLPESRDEITDFYSFLDKHLAT
jgi:hypothetical protein